MKSNTFRYTQQQISTGHCWRRRVPNELYGHICPRVAWLAIALGLVGCASTAPGIDASGSSEVRLADGRSVKIPTSGPLADPRAIRLAAEIADLDRRLQHGATQSIADPDIRKAVQDIVVEARDRAAEKIDLAYRLATSTSAGSLDQTVLQEGADSIRKATELLAGPPTKVFVRTQITVRGDAYAIEYVTATEHRRKEDVWKNYTPGLPMKVGDYVFRLLQRDGKGVPAYRRIEIRTDPTLQVIEPVRGGVQP